MRPPHRAWDRGSLAVDPKWSALIRRPVVVGTIGMAFGFWLNVIRTGDEEHGCVWLTTYPTSQGDGEADRREVYGDA